MTAVAYYCAAPLQEFAGVDGRRVAHVAHVRLIGCAERVRRDPRTAYERLLWGSATRSNTWRGMPAPTLPASSMKRLSRPLCSAFQGLVVIPCGSGVEHKRADGYGTAGHE